MTGQQNCSHLSKQRLGPVLPQGLVLGQQGQSLLFSYTVFDIPGKTVSLEHFVLGIIKY